jgi:5'-3' exonuclease
MAARDARVGRVLSWTPDKDLAQCVAGTVLQLYRRRGVVRHEVAVLEKWGVRPESIPDYLAVVGDAADGYPGLLAWGQKPPRAFSRFPHFEDVPHDWREWHPSIRGAQRLAGALSEQWHEVLLYRTLATLRPDAPVSRTIDELEWKGPCRRICTLLRPAAVPRAI